MNNEQREQQMMTYAETYAAEIYKDEPDNSHTDEQLCETINDFCAGWRVADNSRWIPVEERLPKENEEVLAYNAENEEVIACDYHHKMFHCWPDVFGKSITHWMPLPQLPQGKEDKK